MNPTGDAYSEGLDQAVDDWMIAYRCPEHPDEIILLGQRGMHALLTEVLEDVDVSALPVVGPGLR